MSNHKHAPKNHHGKEKYNAIVTNLKRIREEVSKEVDRAEHVG